MDRLRVVKGHGTENDFVIVPDLDGAMELTPELTRALCDRPSGIGADGVLRVVRSENARESAEMSAEAEYFMDYRNADGSVASMCGNGVRVFVNTSRRSASLMTMRRWRHVAESSAHGSRTRVTS